MSRIAEHFLGDQPYPERPGWKAPGTSQAAAAAVGASVSERRAEVLRVYREALPGGLTADEAASRLGLTPLAVRPRVTELGPKHFGKLERTGERRRNASGLAAAVWRLREGA